ncbi:tRNA delta(2)-isopentenylpyrophosphate transferase MiaA_1 [Mycobacterium tuberculosis]|nr:tRNA delta(2)-isopentenylpyrophosphate transferase MiaA_1 [Mycobacterium tuberculosis]
MDQVRDLTKFPELIQFIHQAKENLSPDFLLIVLGPTASGKTKLAVKLAEVLDGEIISADSRQVYRKLDIGTGKDLKEYDQIPYHLIDIKNPDEKYDVDEFKNDFLVVYQDILSRNKLPILCGGSGSYIQSLLESRPYSSVPKNRELQKELSVFDKEELIEKIKSYSIPADFKIDWNNQKRLVRSLEILEYLSSHELPISKGPLVKNYLILGLNPSLEIRRERIDVRLNSRMEEGLLEEVKGLIDSGIDHEQLKWFGLEYKYVSRYLLGDFDFCEFKEKLRTEIHRFAKRQMTYFRKMERDGLRIFWIDSQ